jgi:hypothetical protein
VQAHCSAFKYDGLEIRINLREYATVGKEGGTEPLEFSWQHRWGRSSSLLCSIGDDTRGKGELLGQSCGRAVVSRIHAIFPAVVGLVRTMKAQHLEQS